MEKLRYMTLAGIAAIGMSSSGVEAGGLMPDTRPVQEDDSSTATGEKVYKREYEKPEALNCESSRWWQVEQTRNLTRDGAWAVYQRPTDSSGTMVTSEGRVKEVLTGRTPEEIEAGKKAETISAKFVWIDPETDKSKWILTGTLGEKGTCEVYLNDTEPSDKTDALPVVRVQAPDGRVSYLPQDMSCKDVRSASPETACVKSSVKIDKDVNKKINVTSETEFKEDGKGGKVEVEELYGDGFDIGIGWTEVPGTDVRATFASECTVGTEELESFDGVQKLSRMKVVKNPEELILPHRATNPSLGKEICGDFARMVIANVETAGLAPFLTDKDLEAELD